MECKNRRLLLPGGPGSSSAMSVPERYGRTIVPTLNTPLTYQVPDELRAQLKPGMRVIVPLRHRKVTGVFVDFVTAPADYQVKKIIELLDDREILTPPLIELAHWISQYYVAPIGDVVTTMLPSNAQRKSERIIHLIGSPSNPLSEKQGALVEILSRHRGKSAFKALAKQFSEGELNAMLKALAADRVIEIQHSVPSQRKRASNVVAGTELAPTVEKLCLTSEQEAALNVIRTPLTHGKFETFLLHGVTGSGKTEVYLRMMAEARSLGRQSLILTPEISLTPQLLDRLHGHFPGRVGMLHSALTNSERLAQWWRIIRGEVDVVVGARSAVFAPLPNLGLIVVDEEHDPSYKQEEGVRYNGRDVAIVRAKLARCPVVLGSATPALESFENCRQGKSQLLELTRRVADRPLPDIKTVDMREAWKNLQLESKCENGSRPEQRELKPAERIFTPLLIDALQENFARGRQSLIFLNRRGFANFLQCKLCGFVWRCPQCSVTLTLHLKQRSLRCHHCDYRRAAVDACPECSNASLVPIGSGTEQIEQMLKQLLPAARIARMDRDTTGQRGAHEKLIRHWERGEIDVLIGTQMITKGHDVSGVTLVGALCADLSLNLPDFRASERTFQLLSQVAGRSGRGDDPGLVIVQTFAPDHYVVEHLIKHDFKGFFAEEAAFREALGYPPFGRLINLKIDGAQSRETESAAKALGTALRNLTVRNPRYGNSIEILGPSPAPIEKVRNRYRWQILLKGKQIASLLEVARVAAKHGQKSRKVRLHVDVDPYNML